MNIKTVGKTVRNTDMLGRNAAGMWIRWYDSFVYIEEFCDLHLQRTNNMDSEWRILVRLIVAIHHCQSVVKLNTNIHIPTAKQTTESVTIPVPTFFRRSGAGVPPVVTAAIVVVGVVTMEVGMGDWLLLLVKEPLVDFGLLTGFGLSLLFSYLFLHFVKSSCNVQYTPNKRSTPLISAIHPQ